MLTGYVDTLQFSKKLPDRLITLPLAGLQDLQLRLERLVAHFETTMRLMDNAECDIIGEAILVFDSAVSRLLQLRSERSAPWQNHPASERAAARSQV